MQNRLIDMDEKSMINNTKTHLAEISDDVTLTRSASEMESVSALLRQAGMICTLFKRVEQNGFGAKST